MADLLDWIVWGDSTKGRAEMLCFSLWIFMDYKSRRWLAKSKHILRIDKYVDQVEKRYGRIIGAEIVHHIYPAREFPEWAFEDWNLISVSRSTHNQLENRKTGELLPKGVELQRRTIPFVNWREMNGKFRTD